MRLIVPPCGNQWYDKTFEFQLTSVHHWFFSNNTYYILYLFQTKIEISSKRLLHTLHAFQRMHKVAFTILSNSDILIGHGTHSDVEINPICVGYGSMWPLYQLADRILVAKSATIEIILPQSEHSMNEWEAQELYDGRKIRHPGQLKRSHDFINNYQTY